MDFDPVTGNLWVTENGPTYGDEINLVKPGFNSGWNHIQGIWQVSGSSPGPVAENPFQDLINFDGKGMKYSRICLEAASGSNSFKVLKFRQIGKTI